MEQLEEHADKALELAKNFGVEYCDIRAEYNKSKIVHIENGSIEHIKEIQEEGLGVRILKGGAWGFCAISDLNSDTLGSAVEKAYRNAEISSNFKHNKVKIKTEKSHQRKIKFPIKKKSLLDEMISIGIECDKIIRNRPQIIRSSVNVASKRIDKYFVNSEGSKINQCYTDVTSDLAGTAHDNGLTQSVNTTEGGRGGIEQIINKKSVYDASEFVSQKAVSLLSAKPVKEQESTIIFNPDFVGLLTHEILGHPSEADRVLGKEMAWAGGAWWKNKLGQRIGSENLTVFDDPTIKETLGWYYFDDEGIEAKKTELIRDGILLNHFQNRETASHFNTNPTANMRATSYKFLPLIRMACTCISPGDWDKDEMIKETKNGILVSNMKIPSIDMKRYNWSISCQSAYKIENGEISDMLRDVLVLGIAPNFFQSIDACGKDFEIRPITNCGKGDPMQIMRMGNGGPTVRSKATVKSIT